ncbi:LAQU0S02e04808g1_1 [Lachancea quebecensis]|uniref:LAQU0S02e04808g1_1 n=1 Tax=Lachancea quebecensis TaxID=1654605 RepID=A0A0P1KM39_9SACH|nr:LAQU0S02e04808g1_1 [Lachancea quebecensis]
MSGPKVRPGGSCLVCRRRKVKCDRTKPVCLACIKYKSGSVCDYETKRNVRFLHMAYPEPIDTIDGEHKVIKPSLQKSSIKVPNMRGSNRTTTSERTKQVEASEYKLSKKLLAFGDMSFYDGYEAVEIKASRLSFTGALHSLAILRRDPFLYVLVEMIRKGRSKLHEKLSKAKPSSSRKYPVPFYTQEEIASQLIVNARSSHDHSRLDSKDGCQQHTRSEVSPNGSKILENSKLGTRKPGFPAQAKRIAASISTDTKFQQKLIENEGLDEVKSIVEEGNLPRNPLSVVNLLNEDNQVKSSLSSTSAQSNDKNKDIEIWRKLQSMLATLQQRQHKLMKQLEPSRKIDADAITSAGFLGTMPSPEMDVLAKIREILPPTKIIWLHLQNYFRSPLHALFPVLTEDWFCDTVKEVIKNNKNDMNKPDVVVTQRCDFGKLGCLLIILRLSFLMYADKAEKGLSKEERFVFAHSISLEFISTAELCLSLFRLLRKAILPVLHCAVLLRVYRRYAPDEGDIADSGSSEPFSGILTKMATSIGLHADAEFSGQFAFSKMYSQAWRKCWYVIYFLDLYEGMNSGNATTIHDHSFNTRLPIVGIDEDGTLSSYITEPELEIASIECLRKNFEFSIACRKLLKLVMNRDSKVSCEKVQSTAEELEIMLRKTFGESLRRILKRPAKTSSESITKCNDFKIFIETYSFLFMVYFHLFLHVDKLVIENPGRYAPSTSFHYLQKLLEVYVELEPALVVLRASKSYQGNESDFFDTLFGSNSKLVVVQSCGMFIVRLTTILQCLAARLLHLKFNYLLRSSPHRQAEKERGTLEISEAADELISLLLRKLYIINDITQSLSETYFYAWRISKGNNYIYDLLKAEDSILDHESSTSRKHRIICKGEPRSSSKTSTSSSNSNDVIPESNSLLYAKASDLKKLLFILQSDDGNLLFSLTHRNPPVATENKPPSVSQVQVSNFEEPSQGAFSHSNMNNMKKAADTRPDAISSIVSPTSLSVEEGSSESNILSSQKMEKSRSCANSEEIDTFWYKVKLRNANLSAKGSYSQSSGFSGRSKALDDKAETPSNGRSNSSYIFPPPPEELVRCESHDTGHFNEIFNNQSLLQEHVMQQLQQLTEEQPLPQNPSRKGEISEGSAPHSASNFCEDKRTDEGSLMNNDFLEASDFDMFLPTFDAFIDDIDFT